MKYNEQAVKDANFIAEKDLAERGEWGHPDGMFSIPANTRRDMEEVYGTCSICKKGGLLVGRDVFFYNKRMVCTGCGKDGF